VLQRRPARGLRDVDDGPTWGVAPLHVLGLRDGFARPRPHGVPRYPQRAAKSFGGCRCRDGGPSLCRDTPARSALLQYKRVGRAGFLHSLALRCKNEIITGDDIGMVINYS